MNKKRFNEPLKGILVWATACYGVTTTRPEAILKEDSVALSLSTGKMMLEPISKK
jgi:hypothetical protein